MKKCSKCKKIKPLDEFHKDKSHTDGLCYWCKQCCNENVKKRKIKNKHRIENTPKNKKCARCNKIKVAKEFDFDPLCKTGLKSWCKQCCSENSKKRKIKLKIEQKQIPETKECSTCKQVKNSIDFCFDHTAKNGLNSRCRKCEREKARKYRQKNKELCRLRLNNWYKANPEKRREQRRRELATKHNAEGNFTEKEFLEVCKNQDWKCRYCRCRLSKKGGKKSKIVIREHMIPLSRGGSNYIENIQATCQSCNSKKGSKTHEEFLILLKVSSNIQ